MVRNLSYLGFRTPEAAAWRSFGPGVLGAPLAADGEDGAVRLRVDDAPWRIALHPGTADELAYLGWESDDVEAVAARAEGRGLAVERVEPGDERPADALVRFTDPLGIVHEVVAGLRSGPAFEPAIAGTSFVAGGQGVGHVVLVVPDLDAALDLYGDVLGLRLSDAIETGLSLRFLHAPGREARHHSLALAEVPGMVGVHHLMVEVADPDQVGRGLDRALDAGCDLSMSLGRHTNDLMTSFYVRTPSGFDVEYGAGGILVDDEIWETATFDAISTWGHRPPPSGMVLPGILRSIDDPAVLA